MFLTEVREIPAAIGFEQGQYAEHNFFFRNRARAVAAQVGLPSEPLAGGSVQLSNTSREQLASRVLNLAISPI